VQLKVCSQKDFYAGLMFVGFGVFAIYEADHYDMGVIERMGPGYFPTILGVILACLDLAVFTRSFFTDVTTKIRSGRLRAIAVATAKEVPEMPGIPTVAKTVPGYTNLVWYALFAPKGTP
jgi:hypothetical protein